MTDYQKKKRVISIAVIVLVCVLIITAAVPVAKKHQVKAETEEQEAKNTYTGAPVYINELCPGENAFWTVRSEFKDGEFHNYLYHLNESGTEELVRELPWKGLPCAWNRERERFYYLSESELCEYDPVTAETVTYKLSGEYSWVSHSYDEQVYLTNDKTWKDTVFSLETLEETSAVLGRSPVVDRDGKYMIIEDNSDASVSCYDEETQTLLWKAVPFHSAGSIDACISGGNVYFCNDNSGGVYVRPLEGDALPVMTDIQSRTHAVADGGEYVVCAVRAYKSIEFKALYPDGRVEDIAIWDNVNFYLVGSVLLEVWDGKIYCTLTTEEGLFTCELQ